MNALRVSKRWRFGFVAIYLLLILSPFLSSFNARDINQSAYASNTQDPKFNFDSSKKASWVNIGNISYIGLTFTEDNLTDRDYHYHHTSSDGCDEELKGFANKSDAWDTTKITCVHSWKGITSGKCQSQEFRIDLTDFQNTNIQFVWVSQNTIQTPEADGHTYRTFVKNSDLGGKFLATESGCKDTLAVSSDKKSATLLVRANTGNNLSEDYGGYPINLKIEDTGDEPGGGGCNVSKPITVGIGAIDKSTAPATATASSPDNASSCQVGGAFGWVFCPMLDLAKDLYASLEAAVVQELKFPALSTNSGDPHTNESVQNAMKLWGSFRNLTDAFFIIIFLVLIFSTTLSVGLNNYDIKKMLPRLVAAVILVQFSWVLMQLAVDITNLLGAGIKALPVFSTISYSAPNNGPVLSGASEAVFGIGVAGLFVYGATILGLIIPLLLLIFSAVLGIFAVFVTLFMRKFILIILIILAPLAIAAWVLPNTENIFRTWSKMLIRLLLMYPLIVLIFSVAGLFSKIMTPGGNSIDQMVPAIIPILAFYMVPWTFKWAGGAMATVGGYVTSRASGAGRAARQSQVAKDAALRRKEQGALKSQDESRSRFGRYLGKVQTGAALPGRGANRRVNAAYAAALAARGQDYESEFLNRNLGKGELKEIAEATNGTRKHGVKVDDAARSKAIELLARKGNYDELRSVRATMGGDNMTPGQSRVYQNGISKNVGDLLTKAPDLVSGVGAFHNMSGEKLAGLHSSTFGALTSHLASPSGSQDIKGILRALQNIEASPAMRGKVDTFGLGTMVSQANIFAGEQVSPGVTGQQWLSSHTATSQVNVAGPGEPPEIKDSASFT